MVDNEERGVRKIYVLNDFMKWPNIVLNLAMYKPFTCVGDRAESRTSKMLNLWFVFGATNLFYQCFGLSIYLCSLRTISSDPAYELNLQNISETGGVLGLAIVASSEMIALFSHSKSLTDLMRKLHNLFPHEAQQSMMNKYCRLTAEYDNVSSDDIKCFGVEKFANKSNKLMKYTFIFFMFALGVYNVMPFVYFYFEYRSSGKWPLYRCQSNTWYPWQTFYNTDSLAIAMLSYCFQLQSSFTGVQFIMAGDFMLCFFITQMQLHFDFLANSIRYLDARNDENSTYQLRQLIKYHVQLLRHSEEINKLFNVSFMLNFCTSSIAICLMGFSVLSSVSHVFKYSVGMLSFLVFTLFICYTGSQFTTSGEILVGAIFHNNWYYGNKNYRRMINIIMMRAEKPLVLHAYKFTTVSMRAYTDILKFSYQLFTFFRAMG